MAAKEKPKKTRRKIHSIVKQDTGERVFLTALTDSLAFDIPQGYEVIALNSMIYDKPVGIGVIRNDRGFYEVVSITMEEG